MAAIRFTRRLALGHAAGAVPAGYLAAASAQSPAAGSSPSRVIDVATHFYDTRRPQGVPWPSPEQPILYRPSLPARYLQAAKPHRVHGVVAIEASPWLEDNLWLLTVADREPLVKAVVGNIQPGHPDFRPAVERFAKHPLFRGIRVGGGALAGMLSDARKAEDLAFLADKGLSLDVLVNAAANFESVAALAARLPSLPVIAGHLPLDDATGMAALAGHPSVVVKVSGVVRKVEGKVPTDANFYKPGLDHLWRAFGPKRVLFASNWPTCDMIAPYPTVYGIVAEYLSKRDPADREAFFWQNAVRVYRLKL